jgi:hypothetical protein
MINFFRRIRKQLADDNKPLKYARYAIGEIVLVMIGILLALQVNNWNEFQKDRKIEKEALVGLVENMKLNINQTEYKIARIQDANKSGQIIFAAIKNSNHTVDTLGKHFHEALLNHANLLLTIGAYEALKNIGFEIIRNEILKKEIVNLHENTYLQLGRNQKWGEEIRPDFDKYVIDHFIMSNEENSWIPRNFNEMSKDHYFIGLVNIADRQRNFIEARYKETLVETKRVFELIKDELGESDRE